MKALKKSENNDISCLLPLPFLPNPSTETLNSVDLCRTYPNPQHPHTHPPQLRVLTLQKSVDAEEQHRSSVCDWTV